MSDYDYEPAPRQASSVILSGAWAGAIAGVAALGWLDTYIPHLAAFLLNWTVVLAVCYAMACWKRAWYAWLAFWGMAAACVLCGILQLAGAMAAPWSGACWVMACVMVTIWYWLVRIPRLQPAAEPREIHVIHHVIHHGQALPWQSATEIPGPDVPAVSGPRATVIRAIEPARKALAAAGHATAKRRSER
jgi:hypothetical protein